MPKPRIGRRPNTPSEQFRTGFTLGESETERLRARGAQVTVAWKPFPAQTRALHRLEKEVFYGGSRYGGKTQAGMIKMVTGNLDLSERNPDGAPNLVNISYIHHPHYLGYIIRANEKDLADFVQKATPYYCGVLGGSFTQNPAVFKWPSGACIYLGHAKDSDAWMKYQGANVIRYLIEEAGQIPDMSTLDFLLASCRSAYPEMRAQMWLTANPGGRGHAMLFDRYIEPRDRDGRPIKHPAHDRPIRFEDQGMITIEEVVPHPFKIGERLTTTRVWVPSYMTDNPIAMTDTSYIASLATMRDEKMRKAFLFGDWRALSGTYFDNFNRDIHTFDPADTPIASWWKTSASLDWGFKHKSAAYWHKRNPETKQQLIYREFTTSHTDPVELGAELARQSSPELRIQGTLTFWVSHDLFHERIGEFTWADLLSKGVERVIGKGKCYLPDIVIKKLQEQYRLEGKPWSDETEDRLYARQVDGIIFRRAPRATGVSFMYMRGLLRTEPIVKSEPPTPPADMVLASDIMEQGTVEDYARYLDSFKLDREVLPQLLISRACPELISAIPKCIHNEDNPDTIQEEHFDGRDSIDSCVYLLTGVRDEKPTAEPEGLYKERRMQELLAGQPGLSQESKIWIAMSIEQELEERKGDEAGFSIGRASRASRRQQQVLQ